MAFPLIAGTFPRPDVNAPLFRTGHTFTNLAFAAGTRLLLVANITRSAPGDIADAEALIDASLAFDIRG